jgi:hypothetical protein
MLGTRRFISYQPIGGVFVGDFIIIHIDGFHIWGIKNVTYYGRHIK